MENEKEQMLDLLATQVIFGLSEEELAEFRKLEKQFPEFAADESFERAAAAISLTDIKTDEPLPPQLRARILNNSGEFLSAHENRERVSASKTTVQSATVRTATERDEKVVELPAKTSGWQWLGWAVAAAACVALAVNIWLTRVQPRPDVAVNNPPPTATPMPTQTSTPTPTPESDLAQRREQFLAAAGDVARADWIEANPKTQGDISGDVVWSNAQQKGFLRLRGLPVNDPNRECYQLWIFDATQDPKTPIDGGTFNVDREGEVVVPINAKLQVKKPTLFFNITKEKPGGVVVSKPERVVAVTKVET